MSGLRHKSRAAALAVGVLASAIFAAPHGAQSQSRCGPAVTVSPGDTLYRIATECGTSISALMDANPDIYDPSRIEIGQTVRMPGAVAGRLPPQARGLIAGTRYTVRPGDTLYGIARRFGIPISLLLDMNPRIDPRFLRVGLVIHLPGDGYRPPRDRPRHDRDERITVRGVVTGEGVECLAMRGRDGRLYTLVGEVSGLKPGDRVQVRGEIAEVSFCMQGTTINVRRHRAG